MTSTRKLSTNEVNALIDGLNNENEAAPAIADISESTDIRDFQFGSDDLSLLGDYYALRMINERFSRLARGIFLPMLRIQPRISSFPPEVKTYDEYSADVDNFLSMSISRIEELRGSMMLVLDPTFISILTNAYYGGKISKIKNRKGEFTSTEERVIELISEGLNSALEEAWKDLMRISITPTSREVNPQFVSFVDGSDLVIICSFVVQLPNVEAASFDVIYPLQTLKPIASQLRSRVQTDLVDDDKSWKERMEQAIMEIPLKIMARLGEPSVSMRNLITLKKDDTFPMQVNDGVDILLEDNVIFVGEVGEMNGQAAIKLTKRIAE
ncbi:MAG: flagellar motor switch protein FliM [Candidatus Puniceispirillum sp. TMED52]|nr:flagellar motor switch protein FliM [SAR116 cluster bacterium]OUU46617.1 MAG: flagellar motor switch protein FliM [Candidatus Puniceispirillum sp. TMED52]HCP18606.1 flagellar motor switch protein FliM [Alphaproteobacteria bacterium]|tara:strand:- start:815 stop:1792 length:978 start_codon:yes stop_codon:yes gene_type:complete